MPCDELLKRNVLPSDGSCSVASYAMIDLPPGRLSTITGFLSASCSLRATRRAATSVPPPAAYGTMILIVAGGHLSAAVPCPMAGALAAARRARQGRAVTA